MACDVAKKIIVEVNQNMPVCLGGYGTCVHIDEVDMVVEGKNPPMDILGGGGAAFGNKKEPASEQNLGAGVGVGVKIEPVAFLIVKDGATRVMPVAAPPLNTVDRLVEMVPGVVDQVSGLVANFKKKKEEEEEVC